MRFAFASAHDGVSVGQSITMPYQVGPVQPTGTTKFDSACQCFVSLRSGGLRSTRSHSEAQLPTPLQILIHPKPATLHPRTRNLVVVDAANALRSSHLCLEICCGLVLAREMRFQPLLTSKTQHVIQVAGRGNMWHGVSCVCIALSCGSCRVSRWKFRTFGSGGDATAKSNGTQMLRLQGTVVLEACRADLLPA